MSEHSDWLIMDQEADYDAGRYGPDPTPEFEQSEAARPPLSDYIEEYYQED